jgi:hypothetical protein
MKNWKSAAAERLLRATGADSIPHAVRAVAEGLLDGASGPPTDLETIAQRLDTTITYAEIFGSGELRRRGAGFEIVCASDLSSARRRFTVAHELAHIAIIQTGSRAPTSGKEVERLCDLIAVELLMPLRLFEPSVPASLGVSDIFALARQFQASLRATAQRCAEIRPLTVFEIADGKISWCFGGLRGSTALQDENLQEHFKGARQGCGSTVLYLNHNSSILPVRVEQYFLGRTGRALCLLERIGGAEARAALAGG